MNELLSKSFDFATTLAKSIPLIFLQSETSFLLGDRAKNRLFQPTSDPYTQNPWVYSAINSIALNIASVPFVFQNDSGPVADTPWQKLFEQPNKWMGYGEFIEAIVSWWHIRGEAMIVLDRDSIFEMPKQMMPLDPAMFEAVLNENGTELLRWEIPNSPKPIVYETWEVIHIKFFNPNDMWRGLSPLSPAGAAITQDQLANRFNTLFFQNDGNPGGVVTVPGNLTVPQFKRFRSQLKDHHEGVEKSHKLMLLEGGADYKQNLMTQKDMDFMNQKEWNRDETLAVYKVPKMEVGVWKDVNFAIAKVQAREFWLKNLIPKMDMLSWAFYRQLFSTVRGGRTWAEYDTSEVAALQDELETKIDMGLKLLSMGYTANQINRRLLLGLPDNSWQNIGYIPVNMQPVGEDGMPLPPPEPNNTPPSEDPFQPPTEGPEPKRLEDNELFTKLKSFFFKQRTRQLKLIAADRPITVDEQIEIEKMVAYTGLKESTALQIMGATKYILQKEFGTETDIHQVQGILKSVYNKIEKKLPDLIEQLEKVK